MKKKLLPLLLSLALCLGLLPVPAFASSSLPSDITIFYDSKNSVKISIAKQTTPISGKGWSYEPSSKTLILDGFEGADVSFYEGKDRVDQFNLELRGTNTISGPYQNGTLQILSAWNWESDATTVITGDGSILTDRVITSMDVIMKGGTITTSGEYGECGMLIECSFQMTGGTLNAIGDYYGIYKRWSGPAETSKLTLEGGTVTASGKYGALWVEKGARNASAPGTDIVSFGGRTAVGGEKESDRQTLSMHETQKQLSYGTKYVSALSTGPLTQGSDSETSWQDTVGAAKHAYISGEGQTNPPTNPSTPTVPGFNDVPLSQYYANAVSWAVEKGITNGTGSNSFSPDNPCTRAQVVTFLWRAAGSPTVSGGASFSDVPSGSYYCDAVQWAVAKGITTGAGTNTFAPNSPCTRAQTVTFLCRYAGSPTIDGVNPFSDVAADAYYTGAVQWAVKNGITTGTGANTFSPDAICTRGQIVTFLYRDLA